ncbi:MAG: EAL domain-containing protein [Alphaproteobacteria bacterium]|nr:EAL domain-containing protein [Alphaproteobacteria bacterium]
MFDNYVQSEWSYKRDLVMSNTLLEERVAIRTRELSDALEDAHRAHDAAAKVALEDGLTGLLNRRAFVDRLCEALTKHRRREDTLAVMFVDLDRFKNVNDSFGHGIGDSLLCAIAGRLRLFIGNEGTVARLGGDEFAIFFEKVLTIDDVAETARHIVTDLNQPLIIEGKAIHPGASMGIAFYPDDGETHEALIANADMALYHAKDRGRGRFCFFDADMRASVDRADQIATALRQALEREELQVVYQPKVDLESDRLIGFEALVRWQHETLGQVYPDEFLSVAEDRGLILNIGRTVVDQVTRDIAEWLASGFDPGTIAINVHPVELRRRNHMVGLLGLIEERGIAFERFVLEVTENCVIGRGNEEAVAVLCDLSERGLALSLDDFGTGYASLKHLRELPLDEIKIDRSFTAGMTRDPATTAIVSATLDLAKKLQIRVIAEGIETEEQVAHLKAFGHIVGQGFFFGRPMNAPDVTSWLQQSRQVAAVDQEIDIKSPAPVMTRPPKPGAPSAGKLNDYRLASVGSMCSSRY